MGDMDDRIAELEARILTLREVRDEKNEIIRNLNAKFTERGRHHVEDIEAIAEMLHAEAEERDWCDEYDHFVDSVNEKLHVPLPKREREYEVDLEVTYHITKIVAATCTEDLEDFATEVFEVDDLHGVTPEIEIRDYH